MNFTELENKFYEEVCQNIVDFPKYEVEKLKKPIDAEFQTKVYSEALLELQKLNMSEVQLNAFEKIIRNAVEGAVHSIFVSIDGGTALSENGKALELINLKTGKPLTDGGLHENFMLNLPD